MTWYILKKIRAKVLRLKYQPNRKELEQLQEHYRKEVFDDEVLEMLEKEDFKNLAHISIYMRWGYLTDIQAAFCLGYNKGKGGAKV